MDEIETKWDKSAIRFQYGTYSFGSASKIVQKTDLKKSQYVPIVSNLAQFDLNDKLVMLLGRDARDQIGTILDIYDFL